MRASFFLGCTIPVRAQNFELSTRSVCAAFGIEHLLHPDQQEDVRKRIRSVLLFITILGVLYFILSRLSMHMIIWTNVVGFIFFIVALIGILYFLIRKVV